MKLSSIKNKSNDYLELSCNKFNNDNFNLSHPKSSILITSKLLSQDGIKIEHTSPKKLSYDCTNIKQIRKVSSEMELSSLHGLKASNKPHKFLCKTQNITKLKKKDFCMDEDNFILEHDDECLDIVNKGKIGLTRQKTSIYDKDSRIRCFSSIFSKLENICERSNIDVDSDFD